VANQGLTCPSYSCSEGSQLIGIVGEDGTVALLSEAMPIHREFVERAHESDLPTRRFRFAGKCVESGCMQWEGSCGVARRAMEMLSVGEHEIQSVLPPCPIRESCRWFADNGADVCKACPQVTRDGGYLSLLS
jgi:hypothetical protein